MRGECGGEGKLVSHTVVTANANSLIFPREREPGEQERSKETEGEKREERHNQSTGNHMRKRSLPLLL